MALSILMVLLISSSAGALASSFVTTEDMRDCARRLERVQAILKQAGPSAGKIVEAGCFRSDQAFDDFMHGYGGDDRPVRHYRVQLRGENALVTEAASAAACAATPLRQREFCTQSRQAMKRPAK